jgi:hypothetical protein
MFVFVCRGCDVVDWRGVRGGQLAAWEPPGPSMTRARE